MQCGVAALPPALVATDSSERQLLSEPSSTHQQVIWFARCMMSLLDAKRGSLAAGDVPAVCIAA
jgi:hypothetical protein